MLTTQIMCVAILWQTEQPENRLVQTESFACETKGPVRSQPGRPHAFSFHFLIQVVTVVASFDFLLGHAVGWGSFCFLTKVFRSNPCIIGDFQRQNLAHNES